MSRHYLDNAATSWPKPEGVYEAVDRYQRESGVAVGRGATRRGSELQRTVDRCRARAATLLGAGAAAQIVFGCGGTDVLNLAIHGLLRSASHVVTTDAEHNSVLRPLQTAHDRLGVAVDFCPVDAEGTIDPANIDRLCRPETELIVVSHVSNVTGTIQPLAEIAALARQRGITLLVDAAQSAGHIPIDVKSLGIDLLACSGHKGLLGPLGTGLLYIRPGLEARLLPIRQGGTGTHSEEATQPTTLPDRYESGNHNAPGLVGLDAALGWILERGVDSIRQHERELFNQFLDGLDALPEVQVHGPRDVDRRSGPVSVTIAGYSPQDAAAILDNHFDIETRAGFHCAPRIHSAIGTLSTGGTLRLSPGCFTTTSDIAHTLDALTQLVLI
ncbi:MAG: aminotransferase class V-fold PLP-dependent enzyme [Planctomycetaceae bacterium]